MKKATLIFMFFATVMLGITSCGNSDGGAEGESHEHNEDSTHHEGDGHDHDH
jgi:hypothetical protein